MGAQNVNIVFARWTGLPDAGFRVLTYMALVSMDSEDQPRYWGGRDPLAHALGYVDLPKTPATAAGAPVSDEAAETAAQVAKARERAHRAVGRAIEQLTTAGVVRWVAGGRNGTQAVYALDLLAERGDAPRVTRKLPAGERDAVKARNRAVRQGRPQDDTGCPPASQVGGHPVSTSAGQSVSTSDAPRTTPGVHLDPTPGVHLRWTPTVGSGGHPVSGQVDTDCPPKEQRRNKRGEEEEQNSAESSRHQHEDHDAARDAARCAHGIIGGLALNVAGRVRCPACRRAGYFEQAPALDEHPAITAPAAAAVVTEDKSSPEGSPDDQDSDDSDNDSREPSDGDEDYPEQDDQDWAYLAEVAHTHAEAYLDEQGDAGEQARTDVAS